jgi:hypothetical protein
MRLTKHWTFNHTRALSPSSGQDNVRLHPGDIVLLA